MSTPRKTSIPRQKMSEQTPEQRVKNFKEVPFGYTEELAKIESQRCLYLQKTLMHCRLSGGDRYTWIYQINL